MAVSSISTSNYSAYMYQWKSQELQGASANPQSTTATDTLSYNGTSTVSSLAELAKYAMEAMGVSANDRVTFSQIDKYKEQLESEFSNSLNASIAATNIDPDATFTISLNSEGKITVGGTHSDTVDIQSYFDANPNIGTQLLQDIKDKGIDTSGNIQFTVQSNGATVVPNIVSSIDTAELKNTLEESLQSNELASEFEKALQEEGIDLNSPMKFYLEGDTIKLSEGIEVNEELEKFLEQQTELTEKIKALLEEQGISSNTSVTFTLDTTQTNSLSVDVKASANNLSEEDMSALQGLLNENETGQSIKNGLAAQSIDPNIEFSLSIADGAIVINSSHPDAEKLQKLINADAELSKQYMQVDALAGLDSARKSLQIDVTSMRKRIEMENLTAWWGQSNQSSVGVFSGGALSTFSGVNSVV